MTPIGSLSLVVLWALLGCSEGDARRPAEAASETSARRDTTGVAVERPACSAAGLAGDLPEQPGLPEPVARMRDEIVAEAGACDFARLDSLALAGAPGFTFSFGDGDSPREYWSVLEADHVLVLATLVRTLALPYARETYDFEPYVLFVWPSAMANDASEEDWRALEELYSEEELAAFREFGGFVGWRVGIAEDADWCFFVAGD